MIIICMKQISLSINKMIIYRLKSGSIVSSSNSKGSRVDFYKDNDKENQNFKLVLKGSNL